MFLCNLQIFIALFTAKVHKSQIPITNISIKDLK